MLVVMHCAVVDCAVCQGYGATLTGANIRIGKPLLVSQRSTAMLILYNKAQRNGKKGLRVRWSGF